MSVKKFFDLPNKLLPIPYVPYATGVRGVGYNGQFIVAGDEGIGYFPKIFNTFYLSFYWK